MKKALPNTKVTVKLRRSNYIYTSLGQIVHSTYLTGRNIQL